MKKLNVAITFLKFLPVPSLHSFMLTKAVEQVDSISVQRLLNSSVVDRFSETDQCFVVILALKSLLNGQHKNTQSHTNALTICHMLLDRGIAFRGNHERNIIAHSAFLSAREDDHPVLFKLFHTHMSDHTKIDTFAHVVQHLSEKHNPIVGQLYELWADVLKGSVEVYRLGWTRSRSDTREGAPTLMEWCLWRAPERIVLNFINDCEKIDAEECRNLLERSPLSFDILDALVDKGVDLQRLLTSGYRSSKVAEDAIEYIQAYQQRKSIEDVIDNTHRTSATKRRKM